eukprot:m51a1_g5936 hypothetical protein (1296) ;mRNA; r:102291-106516
MAAGPETFLRTLARYVSSNREALASGATALRLTTDAVRIVNSAFMSPGTAARAVLGAAGAPGLLDVLTRVMPADERRLEKSREVDLSLFAGLERLRLVRVKPSLVTNLAALSRRLVEFKVLDSLVAVKEALEVDEEGLRECDERGQLQGEGAGGSAAEAASMDVIVPQGVSRTTRDEEECVRRLHKRGAWRRLRVFSAHSNFSLLCNVQKLTLSSNLLTRIEGLQCCYRLTYLNLEDNRIESLENVADALGSVSCLILRRNLVSSTRGLERLLALVDLDLGANRVADVAEVRRLSSLPLLSRVLFELNPLASRPDYRVAAYGCFRDALDRVVLDLEPPTPRERAAVLALPAPSPPLQPPPSSSLTAHVPAGDAKFAVSPPLSPKGAERRRRRRTKLVEIEDASPAVDAPPSSPTPPGLALSATSSGMSSPAFQSPEDEQRSRAADEWLRRVQDVQERMGDRWLLTFDSMSSYDASVGLLGSPSPSASLAAGRSVTPAPAPVAAAASPSDIERFASEAASPALEGAVGRSLLAAELSGANTPQKSPTDGVDADETREAASGAPQQQPSQALQAPVAVAAALAESYAEPGCSPSPPSLARSSRGMSGIEFDPENLDEDDVFYAETADGVDEDEDEDDAQREWTLRLIVFQNDTLSECSAKDCAAVMQHNLRALARIASRVEPAPAIDLTGSNEQPRQPQQCVLRPLVSLEFGSGSSRVARAFRLEAEASLAAFLKKLEPYKPAARTYECLKCGAQFGEDVDKCPVCKRPAVIRQSIRVDRPGNRASAMFGSASKLFEAASASFAAAASMPGGADAAAAAPGTAAGAVVEPKLDLVLPTAETFGSTLLGNLLFFDYHGPEAPNGPPRRAQQRASGGFDNIFTPAFVSKSGAGAEPLRVPAPTSVVAAPFSFGNADAAAFDARMDSDAWSNVSVQAFLKIRVLRSPEEAFAAGLACTCVKFGSGADSEQRCVAVLSTARAYVLGIAKDVCDVRDWLDCVPVSSSPLAELRRVVVGPSHHWLRLEFAAGPSWVLVVRSHDRGQRFAGLLVDAASRACADASVAQPPSVVHATHEVHQALAEAIRAGVGGPRRGASGKRSSAASASLLLPPPAVNLYAMVFQRGPVEVHQAPGSSAVSSVSSLLRTGSSMLMGSGGSTLFRDQLGAGVQRTLVATDVSLVLLTEDIGHWPLPEGDASPPSTPHFVVTATAPVCDVQYVARHGNAAGLSVVFAFDGDDDGASAVVAAAAGAGHCAGACRVAWHLAAVHKTEVDEVLRVIARLYRAKMHVDLEVVDRDWPFAI